MVDFIGFLASFISFVMFIPSAMAVVKNRHNVIALQGSSVGMNVLLLMNACLWFVYGFLTKAFWVAAPGLVNLPLAVISIYFILRSRNKNNLLKNNK